MKLMTEPGSGQGALDVIGLGCALHQASKRCGKPVQRFIALDCLNDGIHLLTKTAHVVSLRCSALHASSTGSQSAQAYDPIEAMNTIWYPSPRVVTASKRDQEGQHRSQRRSQSFSTTQDRVKATAV